MSEAILIVNNADLSVGFRAEAEAVKQFALMQSSLIARVTNEADNKQAADAQTMLAGLRRDVEKARVAAKAPFLKINREIDDQASVWIAEVLAEEKRVSMLCGDYHAFLAEKQRIAEETARKEALKIEREKQDEIQRIAREEAMRNAKLAADEAKALQAVNDAKNAQAREIAEREAIKIKQLQEQSAAQSLADMDAARERALQAQEKVVVDSPAPVRTKGQTVKQDIEITVTDVHLLYRHHPNLCDVTPRLGDIKNFIRAGGQVKGVTVKEVTNVQARGSRTAAAIEV